MLEGFKRVCTFGADMNWLQIKIRKTEWLWLKFNWHFMPFVIQYPYIFPWKQDYSDIYQQTGIFEGKHIHQHINFTIFAISLKLIAKCSIIKNPYYTDEKNNLLSALNPFWFSVSYDSLYFSRTPIHLL